ncbi:MAG: DUF1835 domain-containing protein [Balneola sp.]|nr:MAG: DUF1835 domain-containing protein [Balneola sp.]
MIHILNGDALADRFPKKSGDQLIIMRECLIDGDVSGETFDDFVETRDAFLSSTYPEIDEDYMEYVLPELNKIRSLPDGIEINLWFEDDLFCQINFWFICNLIPKSSPIYLVRPEELNQWGFAKYTQDELNQLLEKRTFLSPKHLSKFAELWKAYKAGKVDQIPEISETLTADFPWLSTPVNALMDLVNSEKPQHFIKELIDTDPSPGFGEVFRALTENMPEYGFGDLQVRRMFDKIS